MSEKSKPLSIAEIKRVLIEITDASDERLQAFRQDSRKGVTAAINSWERKKEKELLLEQQLVEMLTYEKRAWNNGKKMDCGH